MKVTSSSNTWPTANGVGADFIQSGNHWCLMVASSASSTTNMPANPLVISNQSTYYEAWVEWTSVGTGSNESWIAAVQPEIAVKVWTTPALTNTICKTAVAGTLITAVATVDKTQFSSSSSTTYYVDIQ
jgi:hypothetical protein